MRIYTLSTQLSNQIAAGEVIERPASVVKELIENSLDAGASEIEIELEQGGEQLICVRDNGAGIHAEDLTLALDRHATSKLISVDDLAAIQTLGFRGEALASISSVSRLELQSRTQDTEFAWRIFSDGILPVATEPCAHPVGTSIMVRDLFFNTPARRKFLKNQRVEFGHSENLVKRVALSHFHVGFRLLHNGRQVLYLPPAQTTLQQEQRVAMVCGSLFLQHALFMTADHAGFKIFGWVAQPNFSRSQADTQYFYVNRRCIKDKIVNHAIRQAYADVLYNQRHPAYVLFFELDPHDVDVNAHPTKHEVRFRESRMVHDFIFKSLQQTLADIRPDTQIDHSMTHINSSAEQHTQKTIDTYRAATTVKPQQTVAQQYQLLYNVAAAPSAPLEVTRPAVPETTAIIPVLGYAIAQLKGIYILAENATGLIMIDMHAAHERIIYEEMKTAMKTGHLIAQPLLLPIILPVTEQQANQVQEHITLFNSLGLVVESIGPTTLVVKQVPVILQKADIAQIVHDIIADLTILGVSQRLEDTINHIMGNMACKTAMKANDRLTLPEMNAILRAIEVVPRSGQCNHGRPTWIQLTLEELDKFFLRGR